MSRLLEPVVAALAESLAVITANAGVSGAAARAAREAKVQVVASSCEALLLQLADPTCRAAVWDDLLAEAAKPEPAATVIHGLVEMLASLLNHAGVDQYWALLDASLSLARSRWAPPGQALPGRPAPDVSQPERLERARASVTGTAATAHCVVWLTYGDARLNGEGRLGPVTFYDVDWAVPNTQRSDGQDFPHKAELVLLLEEPGELHDIDYTRPERPYMVLARVDLGHRRLLHAVDDAADLVETALGVVNNRAGGAPWRRESFSALLADGVVRGTFSGPHGLLEPHKPDHYGQNATADAISRDAGTLGALLDAGALPASLSQALRLVREAGQVGSREDQLNRVATIDAGTALVLQVSAVEHIAVYADMAEHTLSPRLLAGWPTAAWHRDIANAIARCMRGLGGMDELFQTVCLSQFGHWSLSAAFEHREQLLENCRERIHRRDVSALLNSIGDAATAAAFFDAYAEEGRLLDGRLRRTRNALAHGNPASASTVASVRELSRFRTDAALDAAINAHVDGRPLRDLLEERTAGFDDERRLLARGVSVRQQWADRTAQRITE